MSTKLKWILALSCLVILIGGAYIAYNKLAPMVQDMRMNRLDEDSAADEMPEDSAADQSDSVADNDSTVIMAPDFTMYDTDGNALQFLDLIDKPTILNFWASTCGPCKSEMPHFQKAYEELGDEYNFIFVNYIGFYGETMDDALAYLSDNDYTFTTYFDTDHEGSATYGIYSIPTTVFISADGNFLGGVPGAMSEQTLYYYLEEVFS